MALGAAALALLASVPLAETITGTVVDSFGQPVPGVDIDVDNLGSGGDPDIFNDGTSPAGTFVTTVVDVGVFDIIFTPPPPPGSTARPIRLTDVLVLGTVDLGTIVLPPGVSVGGTVVDTGGLPIANVNIDVRDENGVSQIVANDRTDLFGNFLVTVPQGQATIEFLTHTVMGQPLAPRQMDLQTPTNVSLGSIVLERGYHVTGTLRQPNGLPLVSVDLDAFDSFTGTKLFTPGDNTDATGGFDLVLPAGTVDIEWCPPLLSRLVAQDVEKVVVSSTTPLGIFTLETGSILSGTVTDALGNPVQGIDLDVTRASGPGVVTCADDTNAAGFYQVVVPNDALSIAFSPQGAENYFDSAHASVVVGGDLTLNVVMPDCQGCNGAKAKLPAPSGTVADVDVDAYYEPTILYGTGKSGTGGITPKITYTGSQPSIYNNQFRLFVEDAVGGSVAFLVTGLHPSMLPVSDGFFLVEPFVPDYFVPVFLGGAPGVAGAGSGQYPVGQIPPEFLGYRLFNQFLVQDPGAEFGYSLTNGLRVRVRNAP